MSFPSDYKRVQQPGGTIGVQGVDTGLPRQLQVETTNMILKLMDGATPGGLPVVMKHMLDDYLQDGSVIGQGTKVMVENGTDGLTPEQARLWTASVMLSIFQKLANTATAGSWFIKNGAMPETFRDTAKEITDFNAVQVSGIYMADPSVVLNAPGDMPTGNTTRVMLLTMAQSPDNLVQLLYARDNTAKYWSRVKKDTVWQPWFLASGITAADLVPYFKKDGSAKATGFFDMDGFGIRNVSALNLGPVGKDNDLINGNFDFWYRALSQTATGYGSDDRWVNSHLGSTKTASQQAFALGQTEVPGNPRYFARTVVVSAAGAGNFASKSQRIEKVNRSSGKKKTLTFYAKADAAKDIAVSFTQNFGIGGSPSADVTGIGAQRKTLSNVWQRFDIVVDIPSTNGKTLGTTVDTDYLALVFWFDAGTSFNAQTANLGQQSGTFDIAHVSLVDGDSTKETDPFTPREFATELLKCQRYYEKSTGLRTQNTAGAATVVRVTWAFKAIKRVVPTITVGVGASEFPSTDVVTLWQAATPAASPYDTSTVTADAEL
jgi:hypothetical protein